LRYLSANQYYYRRRFFREELYFTWDGASWLHEYSGVAVGGAIV